jgi:aryl-alcohol dehydrogenase-like predicted oxidoreductase
MSQPQQTPTEFSHTQLPVVGKRVLRMGIAGNYGLVPADALYAAERGANYWVCGLGYRKITPGIREVIRTDREGHVVAHLGTGIVGPQVRRSVEGTLRKLNTDYLDVFKLGWLGVTSNDRRGVVDSLLALKDEGKIKAIGTSIHDRARAGRLAKDSEIDLLMIRYNAKHPGAEQDIFPHLAARNPAVVVYTALAWRQLTRPVKGISMPPWPGGGDSDLPPLTPSLCYRFILSNPHVHLVLTGPRDRKQLDQNLNALEAGPLTEDEAAWVREYGVKIKAERKLDYV